MQTQNRLLDDLARVATGAMGVAAGMRGELEARLREQFERILSGMDLVTREEFEVVRAMAAEAREEQARLSERLAALEGHPAGDGKTSAGKAAGGKARGRKATGRKTAAGTKTP
ncbi:MAG: accessory factor UbiK family protein [Kiloniellaceae bacterium]